LRTTLPGTDYFSPEVWELERERIFFRRWYYLGRAEGLEQPGDFATFDVAGESIVVVVDSGERLHGFYNVCRHRG
jgi:phenylpropionate dioxygenase-like ring-hydroxylating dioxygenase large terminal subunit